MHRYRFLLLRPFQLIPVLSGSASSPSCWSAPFRAIRRASCWGPGSTPEAIGEHPRQFGLDEPLWVQYFYFLQNLVQGRDGHIDPLPDRCAARSSASRIEPTLLLVARQRPPGDPHRRAARERRRAQPGRPRRSRDPPHLDMRARLPALLARHHADHPVQREARRLSRSSGYGDDLRRQAARTWCCPA